MPDLRRNPRTQCTGKVRVVWQDRWGRDKSVNAKSFDISKTGMRIEIPEAVEMRSFVTLRSETFKLQGMASVRHCSAHSGQHVIGVEFAGGMRWNLLNGIAG